MKRAIWFRGKAIHNKQWVYGYYVVDTKGEHRIYMQPFPAATSNTYFFVDPETVGQFVGVEDGLLSGIYEGDLLQPINPLSNPLLVKWDNKSCGFVLNDGDTSYTLINADLMKIVGNVHENPELINQLA